MLTISEARRSLCKWWAIPSVGLAIVVAIQTLLGKFGSTGSDSSIGYKWLAVMVWPNLILMTSSLFSSIKRKDIDKTAVDIKLYNLTKRSIGLYFVFLYSIIFIIEPNIRFSFDEITERLNVFLFAAQSAITFLVGKFFIENS